MGRGKNEVVEGYYQRKKDDERLVRVEIRS